MFEVGTHIDLSHINGRRAVPAPRVQKKSSFQEAAQTLVDVGTQIVFKQGKAARRIPVVFA